MLTLLQTTQPAIPNFPAWLIPLLAPMLASVIADLQGYASARKADPTVPFDTVLFCIRAATGLFVGLLAALGQGYATS